MAFLMRPGSGKAAALYTSCADEDYCKAELLLLLEKAPKGTKVLGYYDVNPSLPVDKFLAAYAGREKLIQGALERVRKGEFDFPQVGVLRLTPGAECPTPSSEETAQRIATLRETVEHYLPDFAQMVQAIATKEEDAQVVIHQDAFAAGYDMDEYTLLGMAFKYAGLYDVNIVFICDQQPQEEDT